MLGKQFACIRDIIRPSSKPLTLIFYHFPTSNLKLLFIINRSNAGIFLRIGNIRKFILIMIRLNSVDFQIFDLRNFLSKPTILAKFIIRVVPEIFAEKSLESPVL